MKEEVLVTGACGFIGSHLVDHLIREGCGVVATDLATVPKAFLNPGATFIPGDLSSQSDMKDLFSRHEMKDIETVFHAGAIFDLFPSRKIMFKNNVEGTENICKEFANLITGRKKRFILFSSGVVSNPILRSSNYGLSKFHQEKVAEKFLGKFEVIINRPAAVIGPRSRYGATKMIEMVAGGQMQFFVGKKDLVASLVHVEDVARAVIHLAKANWKDIKRVTGMNMPIFDLVDDSAYSYEELILMLALRLKETHGTDILPVYMPAKLIRLIARWQEFLAKLFNTRPKFPVDMVDFFLAEMTINNSPIKELGFEFNYSDSKKAIENSIDWYIGEGWI